MRNKYNIKQAEKLIKELRLRIENLNRIKFYPLFKPDYINLIKWLQTIDVFREPFDHLYNLLVVVGPSSYAGRLKKEYVVKSARSYAELLFMYQDLLSNKEIPEEVYKTNFSVTKLNIVSDLNEIANFLFDLLIAKNSQVKKILKTYKNELYTETTDNLKFVLKNNKLFCGEKGNLGALTFSPEKISFRSKFFLTKELIKIIISNELRTISWKEAHKKIGIEKNTFWRYISKLNERFEKTFLKKELKIRLVLLKKLESDWGNPMFQLFTIRNN